MAGAAAATGAYPELALGEDARARAEHVVTFTIPGLDPAHDGLRVVQLSDLHVGRRTPPEVSRGAIDEANRAAPDLVVLTGDYVSRRREEVEEMRALLGGLAAPTVAVRPGSRSRRCGAATGRT